MLYLNESILTPMKNYGARLDEALQLARKERLELADAIGVSVQAVGQVIAGKTKALTAENTARAARFLDVDAFWLATGEGKPQVATKRVGKDAWPFQTVSADEYAQLSQDDCEEIEILIRAKLKKRAAKKSSAA